MDRRESTAEEAGIREAERHKAQPLLLDLATLAGLVDPNRPAIARPWHDVELDRDVVTDGRALLHWQSRCFAVHPSSSYPDEKPPRIVPLLEPAPLLGSVTLRELHDWALDGVAHCPICDHVELWCADCGEGFAPKPHPSRLFGRVIDRVLLARYLAPVAFAGERDEELHVFAKAGPEAAVQIIALKWTLVVMPIVLKDGQQTKGADLGSVSGG